MRSPAHRCPALLETRRPVGHVIDCIGLTGDFRARPLRHRRGACRHHRTLPRRAAVRSSSCSCRPPASTPAPTRRTRTRRCPACRRDPSRPVQPHQTRRRGAVPRPTRGPRCASCDCPTCTAPALGGDTFLGQILQEGRATGRVLFRQAPELGEGLRQPRRRAAAAAADRHRRQPCGSTMSPPAATPHTAPSPRALGAAFGWDIAFQPAAPRLAFPRIDTTRLSAEFGAALSDLSADLRTMAAFAAEVPCSPSMRPTIG